MNIRSPEDQIEILRKINIRSLSKSQEPSFSMIDEYVCRHTGQKFALQLGEEEDFKPIPIVQTPKKKSSDPIKHDQEWIEMKKRIHKMKEGNIGVLEPI